MHFLNLKFIPTGRKDIDAEISFLLGSIEGKIDNILNRFGNIDCQKVDTALRKNTYELSPEVLKQVEISVEKVRNFFLKNYQIIQQIRNHTHTGICEAIIEGNNLEDGVNAFVIGSLVGKIRKFSHYQRIINKYNGIVELNDFIMRRGLCIVLRDESVSHTETQYHIKDFLQQINILGFKTPRDIDVFTGFFKEKKYNTQYDPFIVNYIQENNLDTLAFLIPYLSGGARPLPQKQEQNEFDIKMDEARKAGLGSLAYLYASGQLSQELGGGGRGHRKSGSSFGKRKQEM